MRFAVTDQPSRRCDARRAGFSRPLNIFLLSLTFVCCAGLRPADADYREEQG